jgi:hypothetical protein
LREIWKREWEATVEGAKKEGRLSLYLYQGDGELEAVANEFQKNIPESLSLKCWGEEINWVRGLWLRDGRENIWQTSISAGRLRLTMFSITPRF